MTVTALLPSLSRCSDGIIHLSIYLDNDTDDVIEQTPGYPITELLGM